MPTFVIPCFPQALTRSLKLRSELIKHFCFPRFCSHCQFAYVFNVSELNTVGTKPTNFPGTIPTLTDMAITEKST